LVPCCNCNLEQADWIFLQMLGLFTRYHNCFFTSYLDHAISVRNWPDRYPKQNVSISIDISVDTNIVEISNVGFLPSLSACNKSIISSLNDFDWEYLDAATGVKVAITLQAVLQSATEAHSEAHVIAFADDVHIVGPTPAAKIACNNLIQQGQQRGFEPSLHKCTAFLGFFSSKPNCVSSSCSTLSIKHATLSM
jgi:hypothetical protein